MRFARARMRGRALGDAWCSIDSAARACDLSGIGNDRCGPANVLAGSFARALKLNFAIFPPSNQIDNPKKGF
jgi:hypothetical protein